MGKYLALIVSFLLTSCVTHTSSDDLDFTPKQSPALYSPTPPTSTQPSLPYPFVPSTVTH